MSEKKKTQGSLGTQIFVLLLVFVLLLGGVIGGTMAWLMDSSNQVVNTFTYGDINITLTETDNGKDQDMNPYTNTYEMVPGSAINKDPLITVLCGSEDSWLFVQLEKSGGTATYGFDDYLIYTMADGWTLIDDGDGDDNTEVYYRVVTADYTANQGFQVFRGNTIYVPDTVTKEMVNALDKDDQGNELAVKLYPQLSITAYAVQYTARSDAEEAWALTAGLAPTLPLVPSLPPAAPDEITVTGVDELKSAVANAGIEHLTINMAAGTYDVQDFDILAGKNITLKGTAGTVIQGQMKLYSSLTVDGITFDCGGQTPITAYTGVTISGCIFNDPYMYAVQIAANPADNTEISFTNNTINAGTTSAKTIVGGLQLEGTTTGCSNLTITGNGNIINVGETGKAGAMYGCQCGLIDETTIVWNIGTDSVMHDN